MSVGTIKEEITMQSEFEITNTGKIIFLPGYDIVLQLGGWAHRYVNAGVAANDLWDWFLSGETPEIANDVSANHHNITEADLIQSSVHVVVTTRIDHDWSDVITYVRTLASVCMTANAMFIAMSRITKKDSKMNQVAGHASYGNPQVTLQICLERAVFVARYKRSQLQDETLAIMRRNPETGEHQSYKTSVGESLHLRAAMLDNVIKILSERRAWIENEMKKGG